MKQNSIEQNESEFPVLFKELQEQEATYSDLNLTAGKLEQVLKQPEYQAVESINHWNLSKSQKKEVAVAEKVTGFGHTVGDAFDTLLQDFGRVPTQAEFADYSVDQVKNWWTEEATGIPWSSTVEEAVFNRQIRSYSSLLVELHSLLLLRELFPDWNIYCSHSIDVLMGVDLIVETESKRLYIHVFKNSKSGFKSFQLKQKRGGARNNSGKFFKYHRDFSGHKSLQFDWRQSQCSESTQFINGHPLFKKEYLMTQLTMFNKFKQFGEDLSEMGKFRYLEQFLQKLQEEQ